VGKVIAKSETSKPCICERNDRGCVKWKIECEACAACCDDPSAPVAAKEQK